MKGGGARGQALDILLAVDEGAALDPLLDAALERAPDPREAAFLAELVRGTLQWRGRYDHVIAAFSRKRPPSDPILVNILRLGLHQLLGLDGVPPYAAVHEAGELCRRRAGKGKVGFVNGMLQAVRRRLRPDGADNERRDEALRTLLADLEPDRPRWLATWYSLPQWLVTRWRDRYGDALAEAMCAATHMAAPVHLHVVGPADPAAVAAALGEAGLETTPGPGPRALTITGRPGRGPLRTALEHEASVVVQDATVQEATAWLLAGPAVSAPWLDLCAAPGGKAAHLLGALPDGTTLVAMDNRRRRVRLLQDTLDRVRPGRVPVVTGDGLHPPFAAGGFGGILLDGPCSGTGVLRHHPDGRWQLQPGTPQRKARHLLALATAAAGLLQPGGRLLYATCSVEPEENEDVVARLRESRPDLVPDPGPDGHWQRTWLPGGKDTPAGGDGFFAARLVRRCDQNDGPEDDAEAGTGKTA